MVVILVIVLGIFLLRKDQKSKAIEKDEYWKKEAGIGAQNASPKAVRKTTSSCKKWAISQSPFARTSKAHRDFVKENTANCVATQIK